MYFEEIELIHHIQEELEFLQTYSKDVDYYSFSRNPVLVRACIRSLEIIGEATKKLPENFRNQHPEIPWKNMAGMRDKLIHDYFGVDLEIVWDVLQHKIPELKRFIDKIEVDNK